MQNIKMYSWSAWVTNLVQTVRTRPSFARMGALCCSNPLTMYPQANYMSVLLWIRTVTQPALKNSSQWRIQKWLKEGLISPFSPSLSSSSPSSSSFLLKNGGGLKGLGGAGAPLDPVLDPSLTPAPIMPEHKHRHSCIFGSTLVHDTDTSWRNHCVYVLEQNWPLYFSRVSSAFNLPTMNYILPPGPKKLSWKKKPAFITGNIYFICKLELS